MSGFTPGTPDFNAAVAYYADRHYTNPSMLALRGLSYYTDSPALKIIRDASSLPLYVTDPYETRTDEWGNPYKAFKNLRAETDTEGSTYYVPVLPPLNWFYDPNADVSFVPLREGESLYFSQGDADNPGRWSLDSPANISAITRGLTWSDVRAGIEYVGVALGLAYVGGEILAPEAGAAGELAAPTAADVLAQPEVIDIFGTVAGASEPAIDLAAFTGGDVAVAGSAAGTGAATIPADAGVAAPAALPPAAAATPTIPAALSNAAQSLANSALVTAVRNVIAPPRPPAPVATAAPAAQAEPSLLPLLLVGGVLAKVLFFS